MYFSTVSEWVSYIASIHISEIELGLDRVKKVAERLKVLSPLCPVVIVGGTNGKGSCVAALESIYRAGHYRVGTFTSPILFKHNEQVRIDGVYASDDEFCQAFEKIESLRGDISLTPFEYHTLAALLIFQSYPLDLLILEIGLGGRLDAVNILDADVAIVASIGIDHVNWLGATREAIGFEKAGIFRTGKPAVCGDFNPPLSLIQHANKIAAPLFLQGKDFCYKQQNQNWSWSYQHTQYDQLPLNALFIQNMSTVLMAVTLMQDLKPVKKSAIATGLAHTYLPGRIECVPGPVTKIFDVAHNQDAVAYLYNKLKTMPCAGKTFAVFSMLADKEITACLKQIDAGIDRWFVAPLTTSRAASSELLLKSFIEAKMSPPRCFSCIRDAYQAAEQQTRPGDRMVVFGSFHAISEVMTRNLPSHRKL